MLIFFRRAQNFNISGRQNTVDYCRTTYFLEFGSFQTDTNTKKSSTSVDLRRTLYS